MREFACSHALERNAHHGGALMTELLARVPR
jgi:hypothetical protein